MPTKTVDSLFKPSRCSFSPSFVQLPKSYGHIIFYQKLFILVIIISLLHSRVIVALQNTMLQKVSVKAKLRKLSRPLLLLFMCNGFCISSRGTPLSLVSPEQHLVSMSQVKRISFSLCSIYRAVSAA